MKKSILLYAVIFFLLPFNSNSQWIQTNGPGGGEIKSFAQLGNYIYAIADQSVFRSTADGNSWQKVYSASYTYCIKVAGNNIFIGNNSGVFLSTDSGTTWNAFNSGLANLQVTALEVSGSNIFASTGAGVFISPVSGASWAIANTGLPVDNVEYLTATNNAIMASFYGKVYRSTNNGSLWTQITAHLPGNDGFQTETMAANGNTVFVSIQVNGGAWFFRSTDGGATFDTLAVSLSGAVYSVAFSGASVYIGTYNSGVGVSLNNGDSWTPISNGLPVNYNIVQALLVSGGRVFAGFGLDVGIYITTDGGTNWAPHSTGIVNSNVYDITAQGGNLYASCSNGSIYFSPDTGNAWQVIDNGLPVSQSVYGYAVVGNKVFVGTSYNGVYSTADSGANWGPSNTGIANQTIYGLYWDDTTMYAYGPQVAAFSNDTGRTWSPYAGLPDTNINAMIKINGIVYAGMQGYGVYQSTSQGWVQLNNGLTDLDAFCFVTQGNDLFLGTFDGTYKLTGGGTGWTRVKPGATNTLASNNNYLFSGFDLGTIYRSTDDGATWCDYGLASQGYAFIGNEVFVGTYGGGVYRRNMLEPCTTGIDDLETGAGMLKQNYPNPFSSSTTISYQLTEDALVDLKVYDLYGKEVAKLFSGKQAPGTYSINFETGGLSSGIYQYQLSTNGFSQTKKMVVVRE